MKPDERDWKYLARIKAALLDRLCERILEQVQAAAADPSKGPHARYLEVFRILRERDDDVAIAFDDLRRSTLIERVISMHRLGLFTAEERAGFSEALRSMLGE